MLERIKGFIASLFDRDTHWMYFDMSESGEDGIIMCSYCGYEPEFGKGARLLPHRCPKCGRKAELLVVITEE